MLSVQELTNSGLVLKSEKIKRAVLTALADSEMVKILDVAMHQSKSVIQIVRETGYPTPLLIERSNGSLKKSCS